MNKNIFQKAGLTPTQSMIMEHLYDKKEGKASNIAKSIKKSRAIVYKDLDELTNFKVVEKIDKTNQVSVFRIGHPSHMEKFFDSRENKLKKDRELFNNYLPDMVSAYNLMSNKPAVKFYEGVEGIEKILNDTLTSKTAIYTIADKRSVEDSLSELNASFRKKSIKSGIPKKIIIPESDKNLYNTSTTHDNIERRFMKGEVPLFKTGIQIYDNKISYQTLDQDKKIAILIEDKNIYQMHKILFEYIWNGLDS